MNALHALYREIYERGNLFGIDKPLPADPLSDVAPGVRPESIAVAGGAFGDEGKGRIVDELCTRFAARGKRPVVYRWNGGANAGHTVIVEGKRVALHQLPSGALHPQAIAFLGKGMVIHPADLLEEIKRVTPFASKPAQGLLIDPMAVLALDTHRAFETALRDWESGGRGSTGRGIAPAYADVLYRHPVRMRDLMADDWRDRLGRHYELYAALVRGLGGDLASTGVLSLGAGTIRVGAKDEFLKRLEFPREALRWCTVEVHEQLGQFWAGNHAFIFEGAQAIGIDPRWGVYPDVTASDPTFDGILHSTEGLIRPEHIAVRAGALKATYMSSVGMRRLPTQMDEALASRIREDAHEYGATTRRPRDIAHLDLPCLRFLARVSGMTHLILTHLDVAYGDMPIKVCTHYTDRQGNEIPYRPDQEYLDAVTPHYVELPSWDGAALRGANALEKLPGEALRYIAFITQALGVTPIMGTTGPEREAVFSWIPAAGG